MFTDAHHATQRTTPAGTHLIWWAVLHTLSMVARYHPEQWIHLIDVNRSPWAVPLEHILDEAVEASPEVIFQALDTEPIPQN